MPKTLGSGFVNCRAFVRERFGEEALQRVLARLAPVDGEMMMRANALGWYDLGCYARMLRAVDAELGNGELRLLGELGRFQAECDTPRLFRTLMRLATPSTILQWGMALWTQYSDTGSWKIERLGRSRFRGTLTGVGLVDAALCAEVRGYAERLVELAGGRGVIALHTQCEALGDPACVFEGEWLGVGAQAGATGVVGSVGSASAPP
jgi:hypothetical protein